MLEKDRSLLIVTDIQGKLASLMFEKETLFRNIGIMIDGIQALGIPILWVEQYPEGLGSTVPEVASHLKGNKPLPKKTFSSLRDPVINARFNELQRDQVILVGIETHVCIYQTSMDLLSLSPCWRTRRASALSQQAVAVGGVEVHVVEDAVSSRSAFNKHIGLEKIARAGGHITSVETALFELLELAEGEAFKKILKLIK